MSNQRLEMFEGNPHYVHSKTCSNYCDYTCNGERGFTLADRLAARRYWFVGDTWKDAHGQIHEVVQVSDKGLAKLRMIHPIRTRPHTQKPIPVDWVKCK